MLSTINNSRSPVMNRPRIAHSRTDLLNLTLSGLIPMFDQENQLFCHRRWLSPSGPVNEGLSRRYTMITLLGVMQSEVNGLPALLDHKTILRGLVKDIHWLDNMGDLGLLLWTCAVAQPEIVTDPGTSLTLQDVFRHPDARQRTTMELAWLLAGLAHRKLSLRANARDHADTAFEAYKLLMQNQGPHGIFGHSARYRSASGLVRGHIGSFADQVYPIYALAKFGQAFGLEPALKAAQKCAEAICRMQGPLGQWWWHYDAKKGRVFERYPVYAVHQDGMGPMALFALGDALQTDFSEPIYRGLAWISGNNELGRDLRDSSSGMIWRSVYRPASWKTRRDEVRELLRPRRIAEPIDDLKILFECRPYHLGWLLYAFAGRDCT
jgi:hypothetical protein